jgi:hypothetical protein
MEAVLAGVAGFIAKADVLMYDCQLGFPGRISDNIAHDLGGYQGSSVIALIQER